MKKICLYAIAILCCLLLNMSAVNAASLSNDTIQIRVRELLEQYAAGWNQQDANKLQQTWDLDYDLATYIPVESSEIIRGGKSIVEYYQSAIPNVASVKLDYPIIDLMGDRAMVIVKTDFEINNEDGSSYPFPLKTSFTLQKTGDRWLTIHYAESATMN